MDLVDKYLGEGRRITGKSLGIKYTGARSYARQMSAIERGGRKDDSYHKIILRQQDYDLRKKVDNWKQSDWSKAFKESERDFRSNQKELLDKIYPRTVSNAILWVNKNLPSSYGRTPYQKAHSMVNTAHKKMKSSYEDRFTGDKKKAMGKEAFWTIVNSYAQYIVSTLEGMGWKASDVFNN